jgi:hypothetical protein
MKELTDFVVLGLMLPEGPLPILPAALQFRGPERTLFYVPEKIRAAREHVPSPSATRCRTRSVRYVPRKWETTKHGNTGAGTGT